MLKIFKKEGDVWISKGDMNFDDPSVRLERPLGSNEITIVLNDEFNLVGSKADIERLRDHCNAILK
jgi:hypothetical protein